MSSRLDRTKFSAGSGTSLAVGGVTFQPVDRPSYACPPLDFIGFSMDFRGVLEEMLCWPVMRRLGHIRQLCWNHQPIDCSTMRVGALPVPIFEQTRLDHSRDVMAIALLIAFRNRLPKREQDLLRFCALVHDVATPAGGDLTMSLDRNFFDDENGFPRFYQTETWKRVKQEHGFDEREVYDIIKGRGTLGAILNIADRIGYVARDLQEHLAPFKHGPIPSEFGERIRALADKRPDICALWDMVVVRDGAVAFTDVEQLADFLTVRVLLFRDNYLGPDTRYMRVIVASILEWLAGSGCVSHEDLLVMTDRDIEKLVHEYSRFECSGFNPGMMGFPHVEAHHPTLEAARARERELVSQGHVITLSRDFTGRIKPSTDLLAVMPGGDIVPFRDACPYRAREIEELAAPKTHVTLWWLEGTKLPSTFREKFTTFRVKLLSS